MLAVFWTNDSSCYHTIFSKIGADIIVLKWSIKDTDNNIDDSIKLNTYYSIITHSSDAESNSTSTQYELISDVFSRLTDEIDSRMIASEQRVIFALIQTQITVHNGSISNRGRRAVSDKKMLNYNLIQDAGVIDLYNINFSNDNFDKLWEKVMLVLY